VNLLIRGGLLALAAICLPACNSVTADSIETFNRALSGKVNEIPVAQIRAVTADSLLIKAAGAEALYVKLSSDGGRVNWYGLTEEVQTSHGRITQLLGFKNDALIPLVADDPFATGLMQVTDGTQVLRYVDYPLSYQTGLEQYATYYRGPVENVQILDRVESHQRIDEVIRMPQLNYEAINYYWLDVQSGHVRRSIQHLSPEMPALDITLTRLPPAGDAP
tara:strand:- start:508 stop:1167 length:660 start_codon:yes stop_codon:yes gene_type:complete